MCVSCSVVSASLQPHGPQPTRSLCPWDSPGKNTGVGCHFLLQKELQKESEVSQSCLTLCDPMDCSLSGSPSMEFSRQEYWSGLPFPSPNIYMLFLFLLHFKLSIDSAAAAKSLQSCLTLCDLIDGSAVPGILQARTLEWVAISFSNA